jgi:hypothetical protein
VKRLTATLIAVLLLAEACYGQPIPGLSPKEKAQLELKQAREKEIDNTYKSTLDRIPARKDTDPWGNLRTPSTPSSGAAK